MYQVEVIRGTVREVPDFAAADKAAQMKAFVLGRDAAVYQYNKDGSIDIYCIWSRHADH